MFGVLGGLVFVGLEMNNLNELRGGTATGANCNIYWKYAAFTESGLDWHSIVFENRPAF